MAMETWSNGFASPEEVGIVSVMAVLISTIGLPITWGTMRSARAKGVYFV